MTKTGLTRDEWRELSTCLDLGMTWANTREGHETWKGIRYFTCDCVEDDYPRDRVLRWEVQYPSRTDKDGVHTLSKIERAYALMLKIDRIAFPTPLRSVFVEALWSIERKINASMAQKEAPARKSAAPRAKRVSKDKLLLL